MHTLIRCILYTTFTTLAFCQTLDIETLERLVIEKNHQLLARAKQIDIQHGKLGQSRKLPNPVLGFESGSGADPETSGMISQTIQLGGKRKHKIKLSELDLKKAELEYEVFKRIKLTEAFNEFVVILHLQENKTLQQDRISVAEDLLNAVSKKVEAGKLSQAEKSRARIQLIQEQLKLRTIEKSLKTTWKSISSLLGNGKPLFHYAIGDLSRIEAIPTSISLDNAPDIQISKLLLEIQQTKIRSEKANALPDLDLGAGLKRSEIPDNTYQVELSIPLPIFDRNKGNIKSAVSGLEQAQLGLKAVELQLRTDISNLQSELETLISEIKILNDDIIPEAQNAYTTITEGYLNGRFTYLDVVDSQEMWFLSREQYLGALKEYHQNIFELDRLTGNTNRSNFKEKN